MAEQKIEAAVSYSDSKNLWKVSAKSNSWFPIQLKKIARNFFEQARRSKFQILLVGCLNDKLFEQNFDAAVSCPDTKRPWKFWGKTELWFPKIKNGEIFSNRQEG